MSDTDIPNEAEKTQQASSPEAASGEGIDAPIHSRSESHIPATTIPVPATTIPASTAVATGDFGSNWIDCFVGTLTAPASAFRSIRGQNEAGIFKIGDALIAVLLVFTVDAFRSVSSKDIADTLWVVPASVIGGLCLWLTTAAVVALVAMFFGVPAPRIRTASMTLGLALLPWLFVTPLSLLGHAIGPAGSLLYVIPGLWVFALQIIALNESFSMRTWQAAVLILVVPILLGLAQLLQFTMNMTALIG